MHDKTKCFVYGEPGERGVEEVVTALEGLNLRSVRISGTNGSIDSVRIFKDTENTADVTRVSP